MIFDVKGYKLNKVTGNYEEKMQRYCAYADLAHAEAKKYTTEWEYDFATVRQCDTNEITYYIKGKIVA
jgi:hypothetical protein